MSTPHSIITWICLADEEIQVEVSGNFYKGSNLVDDPDEISDLKILNAASDLDLTDIVDDTTFEDCEIQLYDSILKH